MKAEFLENSFTSYGITLVSGEIFINIALAQY